MSRTRHLVNQWEKRNCKRRLAIGDLPQSHHNAFHGIVWCVISVHHWAQVPGPAVLDWFIPSIAAQTESVGLDRGRDLRIRMRGGSEEDKERKTNGVIPLFLFPCLSSYFSPCASPVSRRSTVMQAEERVSVLA